MSSTKIEFIDNYISSLKKAMDALSSAEAIDFDQEENYLFDTIIEICNIFSSEIPDLKNSILLRSGSGIRDANSMLGILELYKIQISEKDSEIYMKGKKSGKIFISHRSTDKKVADILEAFLTSCGVPFDKIFCSSLPGINVEQAISPEVKDCIKNSILNIVILSNDYYQSPFCQNEAGIIWFLDTQKIVIALPEIVPDIMEGFLNSEHILRRLDNKNDITAICDIVKKFFPDFITSNAKVNANIDRLIGQYEDILSDRKEAISEIPDVKNLTESRILKGDFSDSELVVFNYFYESETTYIANDLLDINAWISSKKADVNISNALDTLTEDGILTFQDSKFEQDDCFRLDISAYRDLRKLSKKALEIIANAAHRHLMPNGENGNPVDSLVKNGFTEPELLFIQYIIDTDRERLFAGWQSSQEIKLIQGWEEINELNSKLSDEYENVLVKMKIRKFIEPSAKTSYGNIKEYEIKKAFLHQAHSLNQSSKELLLKIKGQNHSEESDLPF